MFRHSGRIGLLLSAMMLAPGAAYAHGEETHPPAQNEMLEQMRDMHKDHDHGHDFEAMHEMTAEQRARVMDFMIEIGLAVPPMDSHRGRELFVEKGCIVCHAVNGVGGDIGPSLNAADMPKPMNTFEFAARMWRGAEAMISMQRDLFGDPVTLTGQDLADLVAFAHDDREQKELTDDQIPERYRQFIDQ